MKTTITKFKHQASYPIQALVVIFDLEGFSKFFSQPDVQDYVSKYINIVLEAVETICNGGDLYWMKENDITKKTTKTPPPIHSKFLGDGAMYIWKFNDLSPAQIISLVNNFYNLRFRFDNIVERAMEEIPVLDIPRNIRFGISAGSVFKLTYNNSNREEFIGYSINLASRLQNYCSDIGFIVSSRINIPVKKLESHQYKQVVAINLKGLPQEVVFVDNVAFDKLPTETKKELFLEIKKKEK